MSAKLTNISPLTFFAPLRLGAMIRFWLLGLFARSGTSADLLCDLCELCERLDFSIRFFHQKKKDKMVDYYEKNFEAYFERTVQIDPASFLKPFADRLPAGVTILDVGCGSGRDMLWLKNRGFAVTGFERSPGLAGLAEERAGCPVIKGDFTGFDFSRLAFDALLLCGSLVHLPPAKLPVVLDNLLKALNTPGWVFLSLKAGRGQTVDQWDRRFHLWQQEALEEILGRKGLQVLDFFRSMSAAGTGEPWLGYVLAYS